MRSPTTDPTYILVATVAAVVTLVVCWVVAAFSDPVEPIAKIIYIEKQAEIRYLPRECPRDSPSLTVVRSFETANNDRANMGICLYYDAEGKFDSSDVVRDEDDPIQVAASDEPAITEEIVDALDPELFNDLEE